MMLFAFVVILKFVIFVKLCKYRNICCISPVISFSLCPPFDASKLVLDTTAMASSRALWQPQIDSCANRDVDFIQLFEQYWHCWPKSSRLLLTWSRKSQQTQRSVSHCLTVVEHPSCLMILIWSCLSPTNRHLSRLNGTCQRTGPCTSQWYV